MNVQGEMWYLNRRDGLTMNVQGEMWYLNRRDGLKIRIVCKHFNDKLFITTFYDVKTQIDNIFEYLVINLFCDIQISSFCLSVTKPTLQ